jgi:hypothetical protein
VLNVPDSAIANYQRLRARYPSSLYAARVQPKLMEVELRNKAVADSLAQKHKALQDSLAQKHKAAPDSLGQSHKTEVDSLVQNHKASVDSLLQKNEALTDSTAQKQNSRPDLKRRRMIDDDTPVNRRSQQPPADRDSTLVPEGPPADTTQTRRNLPPISNPEDRD